MRHKGSGLRFSESCINVDTFLTVNELLFLLFFVENHSESVTLLVHGFARKQMNRCITTYQQSLI